MNEGDANETRRGEGRRGEGVRRVPAKEETKIPPRSRPSQAPTVAPILKVPLVVCVVTARVRQFYRLRRIIDGRVPFPALGEKRKKKPIRSCRASNADDIRARPPRGEGKGNAVIAPYPVSLARTESRSGASGSAPPPPPPRPCPAFRSPPSSRAPRAPAADSPPSAWREPRSLALGPNVRELRRRAPTCPRNSRRGLS